MDRSYPPPGDSLFAGSEWGGNKVLWIVDPASRDRLVLVRGGRLDGPEELRFEGGRLPARELKLRRGVARPSFTRVRAAGCYAYQIDGTSFTRTIVFEAQRPS